MQTENGALVYKADPFNEMKSKEMMNMFNPNKMVCIIK